MGGHIWAYLNVHSWNGNAINANNKNLLLPGGNGIRSIIKHIYTAWFYNLHWNIQRLIFSVLKNSHEWFWIPRLIFPIFMCQSRLHTGSSLLNTYHPNSFFPRLVMSFAISRHMALVFFLGLLKQWSVQGQSGLHFISLFIQIQKWVKLCTAWKMSIAHCVLLKQIKMWNCTGPEVASF